MAALFTPLQCDNTVSGLDPQGPADIPELFTFLIISIRKRNLSHFVKESKKTPFKDLIPSTLESENKTYIDKNGEPGRGTDTSGHKNAPVM